VVAAAERACAARFNGLADPTPSKAHSARKSEFRKLPNKPAGTSTATIKIHTQDAAPERRRAPKRPQTRADAAAPAEPSS
jgi:hypothetical protein